MADHCPRCKRELRANMTFCDHGWDAPLGRIPHPPGLVAGELVLAAPACRRCRSGCVRVAPHDVAGTGSVFRNGDRHDHRSLILLPRRLECSRRRRRVGRGCVEQESVREAADGGANDDRSAGEGLAIDLEPRDAPGTERQRAELEAQQLIEIAVLGLEMLRGEERPEGRLTPNKGLFGKIRDAFKGE